MVKKGRPLAVAREKKKRQPVFMEGERIGMIDDWRRKKAASPFLLGKLF
jgi:hypothetical protein